MRRLISLIGIDPVRGTWISHKAGKISFMVSRKRTNEYSRFSSSVTAETRKYMRKGKRNMRNWRSGGGCSSGNPGKGACYFRKAYALFTEITHALRKWLNSLLSNKCPECGAPMVVIRHQTGTRGESFPVLHCTGCHQEYILS